MLRPNYIYLRGNLGRDPTPRKTSSLLDMAVCTLATNCQHGTGPDVFRYTQWHDLVAYADMAPVLLTFKRGQFVEIEGHFSYRLRDGKPTRELTVVVDRITAVQRQASGSPEPEPAVGK